MIANLLGRAVRAAMPTAAMIGAGYGVMKGSGAIADKLEMLGENPAGYEVGGGITGGIRAIGAIAGVGMMGGAGVGAAGKLGSPVTRALRRRFHNKTTGKIDRFTRGAAKFSSVGAAGWGLGKVGQGAAAVGKGLLRTPLAMGSNIGALATWGRLGSYGAKHMGASMFGWGALAGAAKIGIEANSHNLSMMPGGESIGRINANRRAAGLPGEFNSAAGLNMSFAGQQMYDPSRMSSARNVGMGSGGTAGLVQSLHQLR